MSSRSSARRAGTDRTRRGLFTAAAAGFAAALPVSGHAQSAQSDGHREPGHSIVGSWFAHVTATDPPIGEFDTLTTFHSDGTLIDSRRYLAKPTPFGDLLETTGHGAWRRTSRDSVEAFLQAFVQSVDTGLVIGTDNVRLSLVLSQDALSLGGTFTTQLKDTAGTVIIEFSGQYSGTRILA